jgi:hypothetical protein
MRIDMNDHTTWIACLTGASYGISGALLLGDVMHWINANAAAIGVMLGFLTYLTNLWFNIRRDGYERSKLNDE